MQVLIIYIIIFFNLVHHIFNRIEHQNLSQHYFNNAANWLLASGNNEYDDFVDSWRWQRL